MHSLRTGSGKPLLLIHGLGSSLRNWDPVLPALSAQREVIAVDLPGFGQTPALTGEVSCSPDRNRRRKETRCPPFPIFDDQRTVSGNSRRVRPGAAGQICVSALQRVRPEFGGQFQQSVVAADHVGRKPDLLCRRSGLVFELASGLWTSLWRVTSRNVPD